MRIDDNSQGALDALFDAEPEGVHILPGRQDGEIVVSFIQDHFVHSAAFEPKSYFDHISFGALEWLYKQYGDLKAQVLNLSQVEQENALLKEEVARLNHQIFGVSSEQSAEVEDPASPPPPPEPDQNVIPLPTNAHPKAQVSPKGGRKPLPAHLPRERIVYELPAEERLCPCCNREMHAFEDEPTEQLTVIPAQYKVLQHVRMKYSCRDCKEMKTAPGPKWLIAKSSYSSADFLAHVICSKYQFGLPFYRQEAIFEQAGLPFNRTTLANLTIGCADKLSALYETLRDELLMQDVIHADETSVQVLKEVGKKPQSRSFLWLYRSREDMPQQIALFDYQMSRRQEHPREFLGIGGERPYAGYIQVDGYAGYNRLPGVTRVGCMAHVRRKFTAALNVLPEGVAKRQSPAHQAIDIIGRLYGVERKIKGAPHRVRYRVRQEESVPILHELKAWLDDMKPKVVPNSGLGKALGYALDQWIYVSRYVDDGRLAIDNNIAEREIKAVVIGRKNWLFADSAEGMYANALMYSLVQTAKANGINPFDYLKYVIETMPNLSTADEVKSLLPWNMPRAIPAMELEAA